jgi:hypothetical protein
VKDLKVIEHITYTYKTTDDRKFDDKSDATIWQQYLTILESIFMLNSNMQPVTELADLDCVHYVNIETPEQLEAFNAVSQYYCGQDSVLPKPGYFYYSDSLDTFVDAENEILKTKERLTRLQSIVNKLKPVNSSKDTASSCGVGDTVYVLVPKVACHACYAQSDICHKTCAFKSTKDDLIISTAKIFEIIRYNEFETEFLVEVSNFLGESYSNLYKESDFGKTIFLTENAAVLALNSYERNNLD